MARKRAPKHPHVVNWNELPVEDYRTGEHFGGTEVRLTPSMPQAKGHIGAVKVTLPPGRTYAPFHWHVHEDELFIVLSGAGLLRYGDRLVDLTAGDCISCPRNSGEGHQIANTSDQDLVYIAIGENRPDEVCVYPDSEKVLVRSLKRLGHLSAAEYFDDEPNPPSILQARKPARRGRKSAKA